MQVPWGAAAALLAVTAAAGLPAGGGADLVLRNGHVWAGKGLAPATAVAIAGGRVLAVGGDAEMAAVTTPATRTIDLAGRLAVPGFNDAHVHFLSGGFGLLSVDLRGAKDEADLAACLPRMTSDQRVWLANALERVHPGHPWRERVTP